MMIDAGKLALVGCKYLGTPYTTMDCQAFVERCIADCGLRYDLAGSNAWYRKVMKEGWVGSPDECRQKFGKIPIGAFLFILKQDGKEPSKYKGDGIGNANHIGIYTGMTGTEMVNIGKQDGDAIAAGFNYGDGAINSSSSRGAVCTSKFSGKAINGGWNRIGLWMKAVDYGIDGQGGEKVEYQAKVIGGGLNLREKPSKDADKLCQIPDGTIITVTDETTEWAKTSYSGHTGWIMKNYLEKVPDESAGMITIPRDELQRIYDMIGNLLKG